MKGRWFAAAVALAAGTAGAAQTAAGQVVRLGAALSPGLEVRPGLPPVVSGGSGFGTLTYNQGAGTILVNLQVSGLTGVTQFGIPAFGAAHVHFAPPGANGPIVIPITTAPFGVTSFGLTQTFTFADLAAVGVSAANITSLTDALNGLLGAPVGTQAPLYFNVHTSAYPGGEIRGNLAVIPEPSTVALVAAGLGASAVAARRRRRQAR